MLERVLATGRVRIGPNPVVREMPVMRRIAGRIVEWGRIRVVVG